MTDTGAGRGTSEDGRTAGTGDDRLWGFCEPCESWMCTSWFDRGDQSPSCPTCGAEPALLESRAGRRMRLTVRLSLPPGAVEPAL